jgi:hypothetical protein
MSINIKKGNKKKIKCTYCHKRATTGVIVMCNKDALSTIIKPKIPELMLVCHNHRHA